VIFTIIFGESFMDTIKDQLRNLRLVDNKKQSQQVWLGKRRWQG
jgi:hypothetical protein